MSLSEQFKNLREALGMNQTQFSKFVGLSNDIISRIELGQRNLK